MKKLYIGLLIAMIAALAMCLLTTGCVAIKSTSESYCASIPDGQYSVLCIVTERLNITPEAAAAILKLSNVAMLATDKYSAKEAIAFIDEIDAYLKLMESTGLTYEGVSQAFLTRYAKLSPAAQSLFIVFEGAVKIDDPEIKVLTLTALDFAKIYKHLADERAVISPFLFE